MDDESYMEKALEEAQQALSRGEFPVGSVMVYKGSILVTGSRCRSTTDKRNELDHAEMVALRQLADTRQHVERENITVFSTLEPCLMCYSALVVNGIRRIVYAYEDVLGGGTKLDLKSLTPFYKEMKI